MLSEIASAIAGVISALPGIPSGACSFAHLHEWPATQSSNLRVAVTPQGFEATSASRSKVIYEYRLGIVVAKRIETTQDASAVLAVAENIVARLQDSPVVDLPELNVRIAFSAASMAAAADDIDEFNVYRAAVEVTYKVMGGS